MSKTKPLAKGEKMKHPNEKQLKKMLELEYAALAEVRKDRESIVKAGCRIDGIDNFSDYAGLLHGLQAETEMRTKRIALLEVLIDLYKL